MNKIGSIPINLIRSGIVKFSKDFEDYGIKKNHSYTVHYKEPDTQGYFFADGQIDLNNSLRQDVCDTASWSTKF